MSEFRDPSVALTEEELADFQAFFRTLPTYTKEGDYALSSDMPEMVKFLRFDRPAARSAAYAAYWDEECDGKVPIALKTEYCAKSHDSPALWQAAARKFDLDGNGFISSDEFRQIMKTFVVHDPKVKEETYQQFVEEADTSKDGRVSIVEAAYWIQKVVSE